MPPPEEKSPEQTCDCVECLPGKKCVMQIKNHYDNCPKEPVCVEKCPDGETWKDCPSCDDVKVCLCGIAVKCNPNVCQGAQCICPPDQRRDIKTGRCVSVCDCENYNK